ncbi:hypothetical protein [Pseudomonas sp. C9-3]|uniref:hypothetical protein n=1 Tax=Pseudomonas sp. C9-3 TaxID=3078264 RepID=UPI0028EDDBDF|nr:hypothetical protein [Pseudomonas sp. C9-3]
MTTPARNPFANYRPFRQNITPAERALLNALRRLSEPDQHFIRRAIAAMAKCPALNWE